MKTYDRAIIKPLGEVELMVCYKSIKKCNFVIVKSDEKPLIGRDVMKQFNIDIYNLKSSNKTLRDDGFDRLLEERKELWNEKMGT